jgi:PAS domain-containing protein
MAEPLARPTPRPPLPPLGRARDERLAQPLESTDEGILGVNTAGHCTFINRAGAQMLGYRTEEVLGRDLHTLLHPRHGDRRHGPKAGCAVFNAARRTKP